MTDHQSDDPAELEAVSCITRGRMKQRDFVYLAEVIKPALVGTWISGGIGNWPQHRLLCPLIEAHEDGTNHVGSENRADTWFG